ncbi:hypothetical protein [Algibacter mikhailovii]|uniref:hypothetical protein n=1 Tax=Algibacter mikhailovii TaxID=425498 RepID=UPI002493F816|nr:hypothetical protein [Algibacter mikhailovii]
MKTSFFTLACVCLLNISNAQHNDLALLNENTLYHYKPSTLKKEASSMPSYHYFKTVYNTNTLAVVHKLEKEILSYNIKESRIYDNSEAASYQIKLKQQQAKALVTFNNQGTILSSKEVYQNVRVPYKLRLHIAKSYPNWALEKSTLKVSYNTISGLNKTYIITIERKAQKKKIRLTV